MAEETQLYNIEAEMCTLGSMMLRENAAEQVFGIVQDVDFYHPAHREMFRAMQQLSVNYKPIDMVTLKDELVARGKLGDIGGEDYLIQVAESVPSASNALHYAGIVKDRALVRSLNVAGQDIVKITLDTDLDADEKLNEAESLVFQVGSRRSGKDFLDIKSLTKDFMVDLDNLIDTGEPMLGIPSGFYDLDHETTGFYGGDMIILAARPSMGKSSFVLKTALHVARKIPNQNVAIFSLEMSGRQLARRLVSMQSKINSSILKRSNLQVEDYQKLADACEHLYELPIYIDESSDISALEMRGKCRRLKREGGLSLIIVDYLQLMRGSKKTENRVQEISEIARSLKSMAKELDVPVIALSQLNRAVESRENKRPQLADLRESGSIEAEADIVMFIYRDNYYKVRENAEDADHDPDRTERCEIIISKHRNGPTGVVEVAFVPKFALFDNLAREDSSRNRAYVRGHAAVTAP